ncbi:MAG TPA: hypothetical protein VJA83_04975 [Sulfuricurvum sp.]|nr:hypothetical protein [Sulfuricurvum sp.]
MEQILNPWVFESKDSSGTIWRGIMYGFCIGTIEGIIIYSAVKIFGIFDNIPIYG